MEARRREHEEHEHRERREGREETAEAREYRYETLQAERPDIVHWAPVWAGIMSAFGVLIVLGLVGLAAGFSGSLITPTGSINMAALVWSAIIILIAFFIGGWIAGRTSSFRGMRTPALITGSMVWALGMVFVILLTAIGVGGVAGASLVLFGLPGVVSAAATSVQQIAIAALITIVLAYGLSVWGAMLGSEAMSEQARESTR
ncbi:MAG TPA: hypothetical protein VHS28_11400 [Chloroflexota bacterium]|nr:hypothetical protein [Chloroflexota bacterium]